MKKYIYPAGMTGHYLAWVMRFLYHNVTIEFIDDCDEATSLESFAKRKHNKDIVVHLALSTLAIDYEGKLANMKQRLEQFSISWKDKSLEWHIQKVCDKVKQEFIGDEKVVVMICQRTGGGKSFGFIHKELMDKGVKVILVCTDMPIYESLKECNSERCLVLYWLAPYVKYVDFGEVVLEASHFDYNVSPKNLIFVGHNYGSYANVDFNLDGQICIADKEYSLGEEERYIPSGYLGFDVMLNKINSAHAGGGQIVC